MLNLENIQANLNITLEEDIQMDKELIETMIWILEQIDAVQNGTDENK